MFASGIMIIVAQVTSIRNIGILTPAAHDPLTVGLMQKSLGKSVRWSQWFIAGAPWAIMMSVVAYLVIVWLMPGELDRIEAGAAAVKKDLAGLGPMTRAEKTLLFVSLSLLFCWSTEQKLHTFDTTTTTIVGLSVLLLPIIGVSDARMAGLLRRPAEG